MRKDKAKPVSKIVEEYIEQRPMLLAHASEGIINISSLARKIREEAGVARSEEAVMISLYRYIEKCKKWSGGKGSGKKIMQNTSTNVKSNYAALVVEGEFSKKADAVLSFGKISVVIGNADNISKYKKGAVYYRDGLVLLELKHSKNIEDDAGVLFHILGKFYEKDISIMEFFSAWDTTYILIEKKDLKKAMEMFFA
ncbi:hypothetical protein COU37_04080 [Candidatus Micrarchaeota archaeon CG10_big_fil_rev_8_21_14_0_10_45_29]|nr:MAG: hypothetical protein COU37_04080 [Candidatus Micrarchaeota archaeon CG10_big_fil_rev_8_21_14_0_10_45_29]